MRVLSAALRSADSISRKASSSLVSGVSDLRKRRRRSNAVGDDSFEGNGPRLALQTVGIQGRQYAVDHERMSVRGTGRPHENQRQKNRLAATARGRGGIEPAQQGGVG